MKNKKLIEARKSKGFTQLEAAEKAKITVRTYQNYEYGIQCPSIKTAIKIARALNTTVERLWG